MFRGFAQVDTIVKELSGATLEQLKKLVESFKQHFDLQPIATKNYEQQVTTMRQHASSIVKQVSVPDDATVSFKPVHREVKALVDGNHTMQQLCAHAKEPEKALAFTTLANTFARTAADDGTLEAMRECSKKGATMTKKKIQILFATQFTGAYKAWKQMRQMLEAGPTCMQTVAPDCTEGGAHQVLGMVAQ